MSSGDAFQKKSFYAAVGISNESNACCVCVDGAHPPDIIYPSARDYAYVIHTLFVFPAAKKAAFSTIIANLYACEVYPNDNRADFIPPVNPDNKVYMGLPKDKLLDVISIVRLSIEGLSLGIRDGNIVPIYSEIRTPESRFKELLLSQSPPISLDFSGIIVIEQGRATTRKFDDLVIRSILIE